MLWLDVQCNALERIRPAEIYAVNLINRLQLNNILISRCTLRYGKLESCSFQFRVEVDGIMLINSEKGQPCW